MNRLIEQYELVKEIRYRFDNIGDEIIGRIYKVIQGVPHAYMWTTSHYCRLADEASVYTPSSPFGQSLEEIESRLQNYVVRFEKAVDWIKV